MTSDFTQFCRAAPPYYAALQRRIDACGAAGRSYEFPACRLPGGCVPAETTVGFWRHDGQYYLYCNPVVDYRGKRRALSAFFARGFQQFATFSALTAALQALAAELPAPEGSDEPALLRALRADLAAGVLGQDEAVEAVAFRLYGFVGKEAPARPLSLIFHGPTGVGKSELAKRIAPALNRQLGGDAYRFVWTELNTFTEAHSAYRLTGAPPGYVGYDDAPIFAAVRRNSHTVFLFDELEKAHPEVLKVFMSLLDEGRCTAQKEGPDGSRELDFRHCIFLFTTNADLSGGAPARLGFSAGRSAERRPEAPGCSGSAPAALAARLFRADEAARRAMVRSGALKEIAGRFGGFIAFHALDAAARTAVTAKQIAALGREYGLNIVGVAPELARALTPRDALSVRSSVGILEGALAPLFWEHAQLRGVPLRLAGSVADMALLPLRPEDYPFCDGTSSSVMESSS